MHGRIRTIAALVVTGWCGAAAPAFAQDRVKGDLAFGYSILHDSALSETFPSGFVLAAAGNVAPSLLVVGEFGANFKTLRTPVANFRLQVLGYVGGLRFAPTPEAKIKPFVQFLVGMARATASVQGSGTSNGDNGFAMQPGFGVDVRATDDFNIRFQGDYRAVRSGGSIANEYRFSFGAVLPLGR